MKKNLRVTLYAFLLFAITSCGNKGPEDSAEIAKEQNDEKFDSTNIERDTKFTVNAADGSMMEIELGKLALSNGAAQQVKDFGQQMISDHSAANEELKTLAKRKNISLPASLSDEKQDKVNEMAKKQGNDFDKAYIDFMISDHERDINEFQKEADKGNDNDIKTWAGGKIRTLQHHLDMAEAAREVIKR